MSVSMTGGLKKKVDSRCHTRESVDLEMYAIVWPSFEECFVVCPASLSSNILLLWEIGWRIQCKFKDESLSIKGEWWKF